MLCMFSLVTILIVIWTIVLCQMNRQRERIIWKIVLFYLHILANNNHSFYTRNSEFELHLLILTIVWCIWIKKVKQKLDVLNELFKNYFFKETVREYIAINHQYWWSFSLFFSGWFYSLCCHYMGRSNTFQINVLLFLVVTCTWNLLSYSNHKTYIFEIYKLYIHFFLIKMSILNIIFYLIYTVRAPITFIRVNKFSHINLNYF